MIYKLEGIKGIGKKTLYHLRNQNIWSTYDLVLTAPKSYENFSLTTPTYLEHLETITIKVKIISEITSFKTKSRIIEKFFVISENNLKIEAISFNRGYLGSQFRPNMEVIIKGKYNFYNSIIVINSIKEFEKHNKIVPIYNIKNIKSGAVSNIIREIFDSNQVEIYDVIPKYLSDKYKLMTRKDSFVSIHFPKSEEELKQAFRSVKYMEAYQFLSNLSKNEKNKKEIVNYNLEFVNKYIKKLPYELTNDQKETVNDIFKDFKNKKVVNRLIQGDVGSGKTITAFLAALGAISDSKQVVLLAPTELLANQHFKNFNKLFNDIKAVHLTSSTKNKEQIKKDINLGKYQFIVGTHALLEDDVIFDNLGLIIIDEQHKFGVLNRKEIIDKNPYSNLLYLTATPIPRTLAYQIFGLVEISKILKKPGIKKELITKVLKHDNLDEMWDDLNKVLENKERVYIVSPAIESDHVLFPLINLKKIVENKIINYPIFMIHGKMSKFEQDEQMNLFLTTKGSVLLATTMIEVGIDVKDATRIVIFDANNFGLSQLHQLRGRVGRSDLESRCYLVSTKKEFEKLNMMEKINDGFKLALYDLKNRGFGNLLGFDQSGVPKFEYLNLPEDEIYLLTASSDLNK